MNSRRGCSINLAFRFHVNFYHSYRGDGLDDRGIGKDIRIIRGILDDLDSLNAEGIPVKGTWDIENYYSLELYLPRYAPDLIERIRKRVSDGSDEVEPMSYNNGAIPAHDSEEARRALAWAITNPAGSGLADIFGTWAPIARPQECMFTPSNIADYRACGIDAVSLYYSAIPFNGFGSFVPPLPFSARYNPIVFRTPDQADPILLLPAYNHGDIVERGFSLRRWLSAIRKEQLAADRNEDLLLILDMDADDFFWEGLKIPVVGPFFPSFAGLRALARSVADLPFVRFALPWDYVRSHQAHFEVSFGQDCADGSWDGFSSWAEKRENLEVWSIIDRARRLSVAAARQAGTGDAAFAAAKDDALSARLLAMSTTHFGMASPVMNASRLADAFGRARDAEAKALELLKAAHAPGGTGSSATGPLRSLDPELEALSGGYGSLLHLDFADDGAGLEPFLLDARDPRRPLRCAARPSGSILDASAFGGPPLRTQGGEGGPSLREDLTLSNGLLALASAADGRWELRTLSGPAASCSVLPPRVVYGKEELRSVRRAGPGGRVLDGAPAAELEEAGSIRFPSGEEAHWTRRFTLVRGLPYLYVDCEIAYPETYHRGFGAEKAARLGRTWDARWKEVLPCELVPEIGATEERPVRVWKHNFEDRVSSYSIDYHRFGPNRRLASVNNHITDGWVAVSGDAGGFLVAQSAAGLTSFAFCPLRTSIERGAQAVRLNPFGTYSGPQLRYPTAGNGLGRRASVFMGNQYDSYAPSWAGGAIRVHLMLAPYAGDSPPEGLRRDALIFASLPIRTR